MKPIVVIGDVLLDVDVITTAERLSPDGAAPVLDEQQRVERAGGAALAAALAAGAAAPEQEIVLVAPLADDDAGRTVHARLDHRVRLVALPASGETPVKSRLRCAGTTVARLDRGSAGARPTAVPDEVRALLRSAAAVLVSDYGTGTSTDPQMRELLAAATRNAPVVWDPHPRGGAPVRDAALVTPNLAEAAAATGRSRTDAASEGAVMAVAEMAAQLLGSWQARAIAVTVGERGALLRDRGGRLTVFPPPHEVGGDMCGAGDCFASLAAVALAGGALPSEAVGRAVAGATAFLSAGGVAALQTGGDITGNCSDAVRLAEQVRAAGGTVVATGGCFDLLHAGHVSMLDAARRLGDCLIVCLNSDESVRRLKGDGRPLQSAADREHLLRALRAVDAVVVFDEDTPEAVLRTLRPHVWVKGDDYAATDLPEAAAVRSWGGEVVTVPYLSGRSTSALVRLSRG